MPWLAVEQFEYERRQDHIAALRLLAIVDHALGVPADPMLVVADGAFSRAYTPYASGVACPHTSARLIDSSSALLWRVEFAVSLEVVEFPQAVFSLIADDRLPVALPVPTLTSVDPAAAARGVRLTGARVRRHLVALAAGLAVAAGSGSAVGVASAATLKHAAPQKAAMVKTITLGSVKSAQSIPGPKPKVRRHPKSVTASSHNTVSSHQCKPPLHLVVPALAGEFENCQPTGATHHHASGQNGRHQHHHRHHHHHPHGTGTQNTHSGSKVHNHPSDASHGSSHRHNRASGGAGVSPTAAPTLPAVAPVDPDEVTTTTTWSGPPVSRGPGGLNLDPAALAALSQASSSLATDNQPPAFLIPIYKAAEARYHVPWEILAAINWIETDYGANLNISSAGAMGWMQFMPGTWQQYGVAAAGNGQPNPYNPQDAIFAAARYLAANGAAQNLPAAIYAYNHATWYVVEVMQRAQIISDNAPASTDASLAGGLNLDPVTIAVLSHASSSSSSLVATGNEPAAFLIPIYKAAATRYHVPWQILAAINWMDTNHAGNRNTSSAGAMRWMQFTPGTWHQYGVAADGHSRPNPHNLPDAIFSAAHFLAANGAAQNLPEAIYAYNQSTWYAVDVMQRAKIISDQAHASADTSHAGKGHAGLAGAVTMLLAAYSAVGGPYSQANHDSFGQTAAELRSLGTDCSGFVSWVLDHVDPGFGNQTTVTLPGQPGIQFGVGHYVTMWDRPLPGDLGHVIINILGTWFESGGNTTYNPAGGIAPMSQPQAAGELIGGGFLPYHLTGL
jgi:membrane-bound lytic murein transglycosylase B